MVRRRCLVALSAMALCLLYGTTSAKAACGDGIVDVDEPCDDCVDDTIGGSDMGCETPSGTGIHNACLLASGSNMPLSQCVECTMDGDCSDGDVCDSATYQCVTCLSDNNCASGVCDVAQGACIACASDSDCLGGICDIASSPVAMPPNALVNGSLSGAVSTTPSGGVPAPWAPVAATTCDTHDFDIATPHAAFPLAELASPSSDGGEYVACLGLDESAPFISEGFEQTLSGLDTSKQYYVTFEQTNTGFTALDGTRPHIGTWDVLENGVLVISSNPMTSPADDPDTKLTANRWQCVDIPYQPSVANPTLAFRAKIIGATIPTIDLVYMGIDNIRISQTPGCSQSNACMPLPTCAVDSDCVAANPNYPVCDLSQSPAVCVTCLDTMITTGPDRACVGAMPNIHCDQSGGIPFACVECTQSAHCAAGEICDPNRNICVDKCVDDANGASQDTGCSSGNPICDVTQSPAICVPCVNSDTTGGTDLGCSDSTGTGNHNACVPGLNGGLPSCGECTTSDDCSSPFVCDPSSNQCVAPCADDQTGKGIDSGCNVRNPICDDTVAGNEICVACLSVATGMDTEQDGCDAITPICDIEQSPNKCVECLSDTDCSAEQCNLITHTCAPACINNQSVDTVDMNCNSATPVCDDTATPLPQCEPCLDSVNRGAIDDGCAGTIPGCVLDNDTSNRCVACTEDEHCAEGSACDATMYVCMPGTGECSQDSQCSTGSCDTANGVCVEGAGGGLSGGALCSVKVVGAQGKPSGAVICILGALLLRRRRRD